MMDNKSIYLVLLVNVLLYCGVLAPWVELDEGQKCGSTLINGGICKEISDCPTAMNALSKQRMHNLERCGFNGRIEVVCCPVSEAREPIDYDNNSSKQNNKLVNVWGVSDEDVDTSTKTSHVKQNTRRKSEQVCEELLHNFPTSIQFQILNGIPANDNEFPHMAALGYLNDDGRLEWRCGGSLISNEYVVTAAHCIINPSKDMPVKVRLGKVNIKENISNSDENTYDYDIVDIKTHEDYSTKTKQNDIALLKLIKRIPDGNENIYPACLYNKEDDPSPLTATGWGYTQPGQKPSSILLKGTLNPVSLQRCNTTYMQRTKKQITRKQICASSDDGKTDTCTGDSGGPLQIKLHINPNLHSVVGITSVGTGCGGRTPAIYTRIYSYLDWIERIVWP